MGGAVKKIVRATTAVATGGISEVARKKKKKIEDQQKAAKDEANRVRAQIAAEQAAAAQASADKFNRRQQFQASLDQTGGYANVKDSNVAFGRLFGN